MINHRELPYRISVGMMVLNHKNLIWSGRRIKAYNFEQKNHTKIWQMPQGGLKKGENNLEGGLRELYEETGISSVKLLAKSNNWHYYDLPKELLGKALKGKYRGQKQKWFCFQFLGDDDEIMINPPPDGHKAEFDQWKWLPANDILDLSLIHI